MALKAKQKSGQKQLRVSRLLRRRGLDPLPYSKSSSLLSSPALAVRVYPLRPRLLGWWPESRLDVRFLRQQHSMQQQLMTRNGKHAHDTKAATRIHTQTSSTGWLTACETLSNPMWSLLAAVPNPSCTASSTGTLGGVGGDGGSGGGDEGGEGGMDGGGR